MEWHQPLLDWLPVPLFIVVQRLFATPGDSRGTATRRRNLVQPKTQGLGGKKSMPFKVLSRHPLMTSARKVSLYSRGELLKTLIFSMFLYPFVRQRKGAWFMWYDGRR